VTSARLARAERQNQNRRGSECGDGCKVTHSGRLPATLPNEKFEEPEYRGTTLVPMVVEQTSRGERAYDIYSGS